MSERLGKVNLHDRKQDHCTVRHLQKIVVPRKSRGSQIRLDVLIPNTDVVGRVIRLFWMPFFILAELKQ